MPRASSKGEQGKRVNRDLRVFGQPYNGVNRATHWTETYRAVVLRNVLEVTGGGEFLPYHNGTTIQQCLADAHYTSSGVVQRHGSVKPIRVF